LSAVTANSTTSQNKLDFAVILGTGFAVAIAAKIGTRRRGRETGIILVDLQEKVS